MTDSLRRPPARAAAQPRGRGDDRQDLVDRGDGGLGDRPRRDPRGAAAAARTVGAARRASASRRSTWAPASRCSAPAGSACAPGTAAVEGEYPLFMPMTTEQATIGGRETFGEPKKIGAVSIDVDGDRHRRPLRAHGLHARASCAARSARPIDIAATRQGRLLLQVQPVARRQGLRHRARARARAAGTRRRATAATIDGTLTLNDSPLDPIADIPVGTHRVDAVRAGGHHAGGRGRRARARRLAAARTCTSATTTSRSSERSTDA